MSLDTSTKPNWITPLIIDLLNNYSTEEQDVILDVAERYKIHTLHRGVDFDLYQKYPDTPYWGDGDCSNHGGNCTGCPYTNNDDDPCEEYTDKQFYDWFDKIITEEEYEWIVEINKPFERQIEIMEETSEWTKEYFDITYRLLDWMNNNNVTYCIVRSLLDTRDYLYIKKNKSWFDLGAEFRLRFGTPTLHDISYAISHLKWNDVILTSLTNIYTSDILEEISQWIMRNRVGIVIKTEQFGRNSRMIIENDIDVMAIKLRWMEIDNV